VGFAADPLADDSTILAQSTEVVLQLSRGEVEITTDLTVVNAGEFVDVTADAFPGVHHRCQPLPGRST
jgi:hypothetical protein